MQRTAVVGGVYRERCLRPAWDEIYGSAGRAASILASMGARPTLFSYWSALTRDVLSVRAALEGFQLEGTEVPKECTFEYTHGLATPIGFGPSAPGPLNEITSENILRFGFIEGDAIVHGQRVVYDPQNAVQPKGFHENGSTARELALVLNQNEAKLMSGLAGKPINEMAHAILERQKASVVVIKQGPMGALVCDGTSMTEIPAYRSDLVWKIGTGDTFAAHFAFCWMLEGRTAAESADMASRATAYYSQCRGFASQEMIESFSAKPIVPSQRFRDGGIRVYLAGPFFSLAQLWMIEQAASDLQNAGLSVFSPYHEVGPGASHEVVMEDLQALESTDIVFAIGDGMDSGTVFEVGYARARGTPVVVYCENESEENLKMLDGSGCVIHTDYVTAVYQAVWMGCSL